MRRVITKIQAADAVDPRERYQQRRENARAKKASAKQQELISGISNARDDIEELFDLLVPAEGPAGTVAGELIRAMMKIIYRDMNDGDVFYEGYGLETCADAVAYICSKIPKLKNWFENIAFRRFQDETYTSAIEDIADEVVAYVASNAKELTAPSSDDYLKMDGETFVRDNEWVPTYEISIDLPDNVYAHLEKGDISDSDIENEIETWDCCYRNDEVNISVDSYYVNIEGLDAEGYEEVEAHGTDWLEDYGDELNLEYGYPEDDDDEEEDEEEE